MNNKMKKNFRKKRSESSKDFSIVLCGKRGQ